MDSECNTVCKLRLPVLVWYLQRLSTAKIHCWRLWVYWRNKTLSNGSLIAEDTGCKIKDSQKLNHFTFPARCSKRLYQFTFLRFRNLAILQPSTKSGLLRLTVVTTVDTQTILYFISHRYLLYYLFPVWLMGSELLMLYFTQPEAQVILELVNRLHSGYPECLPLLLEDQPWTPTQTHKDTY